MALGTPRALPGHMTAPRQLRAGSTYFITRNTLRREFRLRPGRLTNQLFGYLLARAAQLTSVRVHAYCVMSNHYHLVVTDPAARLPEFQQELDSLAARALNALHGLRDRFWRGDGYSAVLLASPEDVVDKCGYTLANPVAARLVRKARQWPGLWSAPEVLGTSVTFERPTHFFDPEGHMPEVLALQLAVPAGFPSAQAFRERVASDLKRREAEAGARAGGFVGRQRVLKQRVLDRPRARQPLRGLRPRFAAKDPGLRAELAQRLKAFLSDYREALLLWRKRKRAVVFPEGTYQMRVEHMVACAGAG